MNIRSDNSVSNSPETLPIELRGEALSTRSSELFSKAAKGTRGELQLKPRFLHGLAPQELKLVLDGARVRRIPANSVLTNQGDSSDHLFLLVTGRARFFYNTENGQKIILLWIPPGEIFGSSALLDMRTPYLVSAETVRDSSILVWERDTIRKLASRFPKLVENAFYLTTQYLTAYRVAHTALLSNSASQRLAHVLAGLANGIGERSANGIELRVRNEELANEANITMFTASRLLNEWQRAGILLKKRGKIVLRAPERLLRDAG